MRSAGRVAAASASRISGVRKCNGPSAATTSMPSSTSRRSAASTSSPHTACNWSACTCSASVGSQSSAAARATSPTRAGSPSSRSTSSAARWAGSRAAASRSGSLEGELAQISSVSQNGLPPVRVCNARTVSGPGGAPQAASTRSDVSRGPNGFRCSRTRLGAPARRRSVRPATGGNAASCGERLVTSTKADAEIPTSSATSVKLAGSRSCRSSTTTRPRQPA